MNIFILDEDPVQAARMQCDKHVVKMPLESAQMLSVAHRVLDYDTLPTDSKIYKIAHEHHPCTRWVMKSFDNYMWLWNHFKALASEYATWLHTQGGCTSMQGGRRASTFEARKASDHMVPFDGAVNTGSPVWPLITWHVLSVPP